MARNVDEVTLAQYQNACNEIIASAIALRDVHPDEAVEHWLPKMTQATAVVFAYVGDNMTARHVPRYGETVAAMQAAKDVTPAPDAGTLQPPQQ